ncbi:PREDICTED: GTP cyclohydrolase 1 feedback regulatory protein [Eurypyga helias]|uniref:GTP cyclohydrolase 1 feedback regulatory protein n=1 Tax=Eurypyga helias TaxID=54383 RepID=UPI0005286B54|nr:PREDICTED: GTP cyclohydrolase 1 feedback regulatory protein [Eurypyga helias]
MLDAHHVQPFVAPNTGPRSKPWATRLASCFQLSPSGFGAPTANKRSRPQLLPLHNGSNNCQLRQGEGSWEYYVNDAPRIVLNKLESCGYRVVGMTGVGQTLVWCLHKE